MLHFCLLREVSDFLVILQCAPKDQFLHFNIKDGWKPLCTFLKVSVPEAEFPHKNKKGSITQVQMDTHPLFKKMKVEMAVNLSVLTGLTVFCIYKGLTNRHKLMCSCSNVFEKLYSKYISSLNY